MGRNDQFIDTMDAVNNEADGRGFVNGVDWAAYAQRQGEISYAMYKNFSNCHDLRVRQAHGNARDIVVSRTTCEIARQYLACLRKSKLFKKKQKHTLPKEGGFCAQPFYKEFKWQGSDGQSYTFNFEICYERNYIDDGKGGTYADGYFIHILNAPYYRYALDHLHTFHIIKATHDNHICWNTSITDFETANYVMMVWVKRYVMALEEIMRGNEVNEKNLMKKINKKASLPTGIFCAYKGRGRKPVYKRNQRTVYIKESVYNEIIIKLGMSKPELGGMLGWTEDQLVIDHFVFDENARVSAVEYNPDVDFLNGILHNNWDKNNVFLGGFVHSHPGNLGTLSYADVEYSKKIMEEFDVPFMVMPIVTSSHDYKTTFNPYIISRNGKVEKARLEIIKENESMNNVDFMKDFDPKIINEIEKMFDEIARTEGPNALVDADEIAQKLVDFTEKDQLSIKADALDDNDTFARIRPVIDIDHMKDCTIIGVGCGSARGFYEDMARVGVGKFYLIDGDISSRSNIASQKGYISEIGKYKVDVVKSHLLDINEDVDVKTFNVMLDDNMTDEMLEKKIFSQIDLKKTILCGFTDNFFAQARTVEISLKYGIPYIAGQHHAFGDTSEVLYWYPSVSKYTPKEILASRYEAHETGNAKRVTSVGSPIFNGSRLSALCAKLATGIFMFMKDEMCPFSSFLNLKPDYNIILIRQKHLALTDSTLKDLFDNTDHLHFDDVIWLNPEEIM